MRDPQRNLIFVHVPKCAGMAVEAAMGGLPLDQRAEQHWTSRQLRHVYADEWQRAQRFALVRHPVARCLSYVRFMRRYDPVWRHHLSPDADDATLLRTLLMSPNLLTRLSAYEMIDDDVEVMRVEELDRVWPVFAARHGLPTHLHGRNEAPTATRTDDVPPDVVAMIAALMPDDFVRFGYALPEIDPSTLDAEGAGRVAWARLRAIALAFPAEREVGAEIDGAVILAHQQALGEWVMALPDPIWRERWADIVTRRPPPWTCREDLLAWSEDVHEDVRELLGQRPWRAWRG